MSRFSVVLCVVGTGVVSWALAEEPTVTSDKASPAPAAANGAKDGKPKLPPIAAEAERPVGRPTATSGLTVPKGETFHLGERKSGPTVVSAKNIGRQAVYIIATRGERRELVGEVEPGETVVRAFQDGDGVLIRNPSAKRRARLTVEVWGTKNLAMYYVPNEKEPPLPDPAAAEPESPTASPAAP